MAITEWIYNKTGQIDDPEVTSAIECVTDVCRAANLPLGIFGVTADALRPYMEKGFTFIVGSVDTLFLVDAGQRMLSALKS